MTSTAIPGKAHWQTTSTPSADTMRENAAHRPTLRLTPAPGWQLVDVAAYRPSVWVAVEYAGSHREGFVPAVFAEGENFDVDYPDRHLLMECIDEPWSTTISDPVRLSWGPVAFPEGVRCVGESEYAAGGMRFHELLQMRTARNRLGKTTLIRVTAIAHTADWGKLKSHMESTMNALAITP